MEERLGAQRAGETRAELGATAEIKRAKEFLRRGKAAVLVHYPGSRMAYDITNP